MLEGIKEVSDAGGLHKFNNNHLYLLGGGNVLMTEKTEPAKDFRSILLFFSNEYLLNFLNRHSIAVPHSAQNTTLFKVDKDDYLTHFQESLTLLNKQGAINQALLTTKIDELLLYLLNSQSSAVNNLIHCMLKLNKYAELTKVVAANLDNSLTVEELAFLCNMSVSGFRRKFTAVYGCSPQKYLLQHKMQKAAELLRQNKRPSEIYIDLGYNDLPAFSTEFKKHFGVSPKDYSL